MLVLGVVIPHAGGTGWPGQGISLVRENMPGRRAATPRQSLIREMKRKRGKDGGRKKERDRGSRVHTSWEWRERAGEGHFSFLRGLHVMVLDGSPRGGSEN